MTNLPLAAANPFATPPAKAPAVERTPIMPIHQPVLKVIGLGGGGCNAVNRMMELGLSGVEFIAANTDYQALQTCLAPIKLQLGPRVTRGLGTGGKPEVGQAAAEESQRALEEALEGADMVFLTAGMGGGTGTGSIPVAAQAARSVGAVTIAIVTTPFSFEMGRRQRNASLGLANLRPHTDTLIAIPNDRLLYVAPRNLPMEVAFRLADDVLRQAVQGITELITEPGLINIDFAHVRRLMQLGGGALMSIGQGQGGNKAHQAIEQAMHHPLLESVSLENAAGVIANFTGGKDLTLVEVSEVLSEIQAQIGPQAEIVLGVTHDESMRERAQVILVVTGLGAPALEDVLPGADAIAMGTKPAETEEQAPSVIRRSVASLASLTGQVPSTSPPPGSRIDRALLPNEPPVVPVYPPQPISTRGVVSYAAQELPLEPDEPSPHTVVNPPLHPDPNDLDLPAFLRKRMRMSG